MQLGWSTGWDMDMGSMVSAEHAAGVGAFPPETILIRPVAQQRELDKEGESTMTRFRSSPQFGPFLQGQVPMRMSPWWFSLAVVAGGYVVQRFVVPRVGHRSI